MQLLAVRLIERRDPHDAIVLGDAMMELGLDGLLTGRSRPVVFRTASPRYYAERNQNDLRRITVDHEWRDIARVRVELPRFVQQGFEAIYNVGGFASSPTETKWNEIWTQWITPRRGTYRTLVDSKLLPRSIRPHEIDWSQIISANPNILLAYHLTLVRVPPKRKRPVQVRMFDILRLEENNPRTSEIFFDPKEEAAKLDELAAYQRLEIWP